MTDLIAHLRTVPARFHALALLGAATVLWFSHGSDWDPWRLNSSTLADGWGRAAAVLATLLLTAVPLLALRWPVRAAAVGLAPLVLIVTSASRDWPFAVYLAVLLAAMIAVWESPRRGVLLGALALLPVATYTVGLTVMVLPYRFILEAAHSSALGLLLTLGMYVLATGLCLGLAMWMRRSALAARRAAALEARSVEVERESAAVGERARLARDLHDVVAHHVSLIAVRAETAPYTVPDLTPQARDLFGEIASDSRHALDELRSVLGVLRRSDEEPERAPQPTAADIAGLVERARSAGAEVSWEEADLTGVLFTPGYVAFRVVQEALTNARRHAPGHPVTLETVPAADGGIAVRVANATDGLPGDDGRGLAGMRERVEALGGSLTVHRSDGEFALEADVPGEPAR